MEGGTEEGRTEGRRKKGRKGILGNAEVRDLGRKYTVWYLCVHNVTLGLIYQNTADFYSRVSFYAVDM